jgi:hypothetical protein
VSIRTGAEGGEPPDGAASKAAAAGPDESNYFDRLLARAAAEGKTAAEARKLAFEAHLDGKPNRMGQKKWTRSDRDALFWSSRTVAECTEADWSAETAVLALASYLSQTKVSVPGLVRRLAGLAPDALTLAARRSELVLTDNSPHRQDLAEAGADSSSVAELCRVLDIFTGARRQRLVDLDRCKSALSDLSAFDLLVLASLYAFEHLVPHDLFGKSAVESADERVEGHWQAINQLLLWKLATAPVGTTKLDEASLVRSLQKHLVPLLFPTPGNASDLPQRRRAFQVLVEAQLELDEFLDRSIDAFRYDDSVRFAREGEHSLEIVETDPQGRAKWLRDGNKLARLHGYWMHRAFYAFANSEMAHRRIGRPENENRLAYIRAMRTQLRLTEVYGIADTVSTEAGDKVDLFQALLSLELTSRFFMLDFICQFAAHAAEEGWVGGLRSLAMNGLREGSQNRFPLTWSSHADKVKGITSWTVTAKQPEGSARMAAAILDFWTFDMANLAERLQQGTPGLKPRLIERPVLKFVTTLVQLPWVLGLQNNSTAAINNLRRLSTGRGETRDETQRIEAGVSRLLADRGFRVVLNWNPPDEQKEAGEVDVLAALDGKLFVLEVKSTFIRQSIRDAWLHRTTTLRKAGLQLQRKLPVVMAALQADIALRESLGLASAPQPGNVHSWIVDTSIECDHERFSGFLKISVEELLLALRDDCHLLDDPEGLAKDPTSILDVQPSSTEGARGTLYPDGFRAERFLQIIDTEAVWATL